MEIEDIQIALAIASPFIVLLIGFLGKVLIPWHKVSKDEIYRHNQFIYEQNKIEKHELREQLNSFYGPMKALRQESVILYDLFALDEKIKYRAEGSYFRTLRYLATNGKSPLAQKDKDLLELIIDVGDKQLKLIESETCAMLAPHLSVLFGRLAAHIRVLKLAAEGKLIGFSDAVEDIVFPLEIDGALESQIRKIQDAYSQLHYSECSAPSAPPAFGYQSKTIDYYDRESKDYISSTKTINLNSLYRIFRESGIIRKGLPRGALILDAGCGSGRDSRYFIQHGYRVVSFDASKKMVDHCLSYPYSYCIQKSFNEIEYLEEFDAVWACASLLHLNLSDFTDALERLNNALIPGGIIYFSLKSKGSSKPSIDSGRKFFFYDQSEVEDICEKLLLTNIKIWENEARKHGDTSIWTNYIFEKPKV